MPEPVDETTWPRFGVVALGIAELRGSVGGEQLAVGDVEPGGAVGVLLARLSPLRVEAGPVPPSSRSSPAQRSPTAPSCRALHPLRCIASPQRRAQPPTENRLSRRGGGPSSPRPGCRCRGGRHPSGRRRAAPRRCRAPRSPHPRVRRPRHGPRPPGSLTQPRAGARLTLTSLRCPASRGGTRRSPWLVRPFPPRAVLVAALPELGWDPSIGAIDLVEPAVPLAGSDRNTLTRSSCPSRARASW